jgi:hypothetical protein
MKLGIRMLATTVLFALGSATATLADTVWIEATRDNTLIEDPAGTRSNGAGPYVFAGRVSQGTSRRGLIRFEIADRIPPSAEIVSARLVLHMSQTSGGPARVSLHRISAPWGEGASSAIGGSGAPSAAGDATWLHTFFDTGFWALAGGDVTASSASALVDQPGDYEFGPTPEMAADVRAWLAAPGENHGWLLRGDESQPGTSKRFDSRENEDVSLRPVLVVEFALPGSGGDDEDPDDERADDEDADDRDFGPRPPNRR